MLRIERILCPTDLSSESDEALRYAVALTCAYKAKLFLLYCKEASSNGHENAPGSEITSLFTESLASHLGLADFCDLNWEGLVAKNVPDVGKAIVQEAAKHKIDLIVMRSRRRPHAAVLLGSTAETVSRTAPCPVLVTHPGEREWVGLSTGEIDLQRILVAHDFSSDSELALNCGISLARNTRLNCTCCTCSLKLKKRNRSLPGLKGLRALTRAQRANCKRRFRKKYFCGAKLLMRCALASLTRKRSLTRKNTTSI